MTAFLDATHHAPRKALTVEIPDIDLSELDWPEAAILCHLVLVCAFGWRLQGQVCTYGDCDSSASWFAS